jgi:hypothetical protein
VKIRKVTEDYCGADGIELTLIKGQLVQILSVDGTQAKGFVSGFYYFASLKISLFRSIVGGEGDVGLFPFEVTDAIDDDKLEEEKQQAAMLQTQHKLAASKQKQQALSSFFAKSSSAANASTVTEFGDPALFPTAWHEAICSNRRSWQSGPLIPSVVHGCCSCNEM